MTARLLKVVNSSFFGFASTIETVSYAVTLLGPEQVHDLILATSVGRVFSGINSRVTNMDLFWRTSVYCGVASRLLSSYCNVLDTERLFVAGLLRDIGHLVMYIEVPDAVQQALSDSRREQRPLHSVERELIGFNYADVGYELMRAWKLPASLQEIVRHHPEPGRARHYPLETSIVHMASSLAVATKQDEGTLAERIDPVAFQATGITPERIAHARQEIDDQTAMTLNLIHPLASHDQKVA